MVKHFTAENFEEEVLRSELPVLVDFYADWCGPCKMMSPVVEKLAEEFAGRISFGKCNVDEEMELAQKYRVTSIPAFVAFRGGAVAATFVGARSASEMKKEMERLLD